MKGHDQIITLRDDVVMAECPRSPSTQSTRTCARTDERLWKTIRAESIDEMKQADQLMARIRYREGVPQRADARPGERR